MSEQEEERRMKIDEIWPEYYENKAREEKKEKRLEYSSRLIALGILGYMAYRLYYDYVGSAQDLMNDVIVFVGMCLLCYGVWYGIAWLDRWGEDKKRNKNT